MNRWAGVVTPLVSIMLCTAALAACGLAIAQPTPTPSFTATILETPTATATQLPTPTAAATTVPEDRYRVLLREYPNIAEYVRLLRAKDAMPAPEALEELEAVISEYPETPAAFEAHLTLARHFASIRDSRAYSHYQAALALESPPALKLEWARYLESAGRNEEAYGAYRATFRRFPEEARPALKRLAPDVLTLAQDLLDFRFAQDALEVLPAPTDSDSAAILALRARAFLALGRNDEALAAYEAWLVLAPESVDGRLGQASALAGLGRNEEALTVYAAIPTISAQLARGGILEGLGRREEALPIYLGLEDPAAWWRAAGVLEQLDRAAESLPLYERVARSGTTLADDAAYRLWVLAGRLGDATQSALGARLLEGLWPNYFTLLMRGQRFTGHIATPLPIPAAAQPALDRSQALDEIGFPNWAVSELAHAARATDDPAVDLALGEALYQRGAYWEASQIGVTLLRSSDPGVSTLTAWRLAYPKAYPEAVEAAAREYDVDPLLIWSVMRQESSFYAESVSGAYAGGLMQVIPSTRDLIAKGLGVEVGWESMFDPATSIRFGVYFLAAMLREFDGDVEYAVAAYNGGSGVVNGTLMSPFVHDRNDFYRYLTKGESREFINRVMLNYGVYQWLEEVEGEI